MRLIAAGATNGSSKYDEIRTELLLAATAFAQAQAPGAPARGAQEPAPSGTPARGGGQGVGSQGDPDPGVHYIVIVDNSSVRVLQSGRS